MATDCEDRPEVIEAVKVAGLVIRKQQAYGNALDSVPKMLKELYPNGIAPDQFETANFIIHVLDKVKRAATDNDPMGEDPWQDIMGYALRMVVARKHERKGGS